jgi:hypothetical protein
VLPWGHDGLPAAGSPAATALATIIADLEDALDAVGDLLVAESVHQLAQGNPARASGVLDALAQGAPPPSELGVLEIPAAGVGLSHRLLALVPAGARAAGWAGTPRAAAEPALEAWCAALLGAASGYAAGVSYRASDGSTLGAATIGLEALGLGALDAVRAASHGELVARVLDAAAAQAPDGTSQIIVDGGRSGARRSLDDLVVLGVALASVLAHARPARAADLSPRADADDAPPSEDVLAELEGRCDDAMLADAIALLGRDARGGLLAAAALGVAGAVPAVDRGRWADQIAMATAALAARKAALAGLAAAATAEDRLARAAARLRLLVGDDLVVTPAFTAPPSDLARSLADAATLDGAEPGEPLTWLARIAAVREELAPFERALFVAGTLVLDDTAHGLHVAQLPFAAGEPWIGRAVFAGDGAPAARRGFAFHAPLGLDLGAPVAGLLVDSWNEAVPAPSQTTGLAFQIEQPTACPPQVLVLAVAPDLALAEWRDDDVEAVVRETVALARLRLVDGDLIDAGGHYLPGLYFAVNLAGDTASTDFTGGT